MLKIIKSLIIGALIATVSFLAFSQNTNYPSRPIELIVAYGVGGSSDIVARSLGRALERELGQKIVVVNRPGASGTIGFKALAESKPDGYAIGITGLGGLVVNPLCNPTTVTYNPTTDFTHIGIVAKVPSILAVHRDFPATNYAEFLSELHRNPNKYNYGAQLCSQGHIFIESIKMNTKTYINMIPYKTSSQLTLDTLSGQIQVYTDQISISSPHLLTKNNPTGKLRPIAVVWPTRFPEIPNVPTLSEIGESESTSVAWYGIITPANVPADIIQTINKALAKAVRDPDFNRVIAEYGGKTLHMNSDEFKSMVNRDIAKFSRIIATGQLAAK